MQYRKCWNSYKTKVISENNEKINNIKSKNKQQQQE